MPNETQTHTDMKPYLDGTTGPFEIGDYVVHIPPHLLRGQAEYRTRFHNLGQVKSKNDHYVFVRYHSGDTAIATEPSELFRLDNRPDLITETQNKLK